jgi:GNAT superfamily N-acetyltransferase
LELVSLPFADLALARRLERAEGYSCAKFVEAHARLNPDRGYNWIEAGGAYAMFDGIGSPSTQTFGLGIFEPVTPEILDRLEAFFRERGSPVHHELSPLAGVEAAAMLVSRGYRPIELGSVLYRALEPAADPPSCVRIVAPHESALWTDVLSRAWLHDLPQFGDSFSEIAAVNVAQSEIVRFLAEVDGTPAAAAALLLHEGVALLAGAATVVEFRRRGAQNALLNARLQYAAGQGCDLAMMCTLPGGTSQNNAERNGFRVAYTRTKWELDVTSVRAAS